MKRCIPMAVVLALAVTATARAQHPGGVIEVNPQDKMDPQCRVYIDTEVVITFSLDVHRRPYVNVINFTDREVVADAGRFELRLADGRTIKPDQLKIATGVSGEYVYRSYLTIRPHSSFHFELGGLPDPLPPLERLALTVPPFVYTLEPVRKEFFDVLLERLERVGLNSDSVGRAYRRLDIPLRGAKARVEE
jgi:hypothetical protein